MRIWRRGAVCATEVLEVGINESALSVMARVGSLCQSVYAEDMGHRMVLATPENDARSVQERVAGRPRDREYFLVWMSPFGSMCVPNDMWVDLRVNMTLQCLVLSNVDLHACCV